LKNALDNLEAIGVLQKTNCMSIDSLLNPPDEQCTMDESTEEAILEAIMKAHATQETTGGDDDKDNPPPPPPQTRELLQASSTIHRYLAMTNHSFSRQMGHWLISFNHTVCLEQAATMRDARLGGFFAPKNTSSPS
ncbi:hypothetical protein P691DRAFT_682395, partial [Macrolepiota fuliginosa MF-IS2]